MVKVENFSSRDFNKLKPLNLPKSLAHQEADLFLLESKNRWEKVDYIFKCFKSCKGTYFSNKLYTINELIDKNDLIGIDELIMPIVLGTVDKEIRGYIMPYIEGPNLKLLLESSHVKIEQKIKYLKEIGVILEKMRKVREYNGIPNFYLNDLHEGNFILNARTKKVNVIDMDSIKIGTNEPMLAKYLRPFSKIMDVPKYQKQDNGYFNTFIVDQNTDLYCYILMIFNTLFHINVDDISVDEFYEYLEYLYNLGISREFIDIVANIYGNKDNENPYEYLDDIVPFYDKINKDGMEKKLVRTI